MIKVGIIGGTGYTGVELLRLLVTHPHVEICAITSRSEAGIHVADMFPNLRGFVDLTFTDPAPENLTECDVLFFATPNGTAMRSVPELLKIKPDLKIIDLAADFRLKDAATWQRWYDMEHTCPDLLATAVYGLPEVNRAAIAKARIIANPGCYPTAVQLGFLPLLEAGLVDTEHLIADAKSGVSGAGRKANVAMLMGETGESFKAYSVPGHRHLPEIVQGLSIAARQPVTLTFVPHLVPMIRGILATLYAPLRQPLADIQALFTERYQHEPFVKVLPPGSHPETRQVRGNNHCHLAIHRPQGGNTVVIVAVIDNLVKGAAGQALQNLNILYGLPETTGLNHVALLP